MAQTKRYHLAGTTDLNNAASWHDGIYGGSAVPLISNVVYFAEGADNITAGLTALNTVALAYVSVTRGFYGRLGGTGTAMELQVNTNGGTGEFGVDGTSTGVEKFIYSAGGGSAYVKCGTNGVDLVRVDTLGKLWLTGGTINTRLELASGELNVNDQVVLSSVTMDFFGGQSVIDFKDDATNPTINIHGGNHTIRRSGGVITINGGTTTFQVEKELGISTGAITINGGVVDWRAGNMPAAALTLNGGTLIVGNAVRPLDWSSATLVSLGNTQIVGAAAGSKVTWPLASAVQLRSGMAADAYQRISTAGA
jgi:hypothetical protein